MRWGSHVEERPGHCKERQRQHGHDSQIKALGSESNIAKNCFLRYHFLPSKIAIRCDSSGFSMDWFCWENLQPAGAKTIKRGPGLHLEFWEVMISWISGLGMVDTSLPFGKCRKHLAAWPQPHWPHCPLNALGFAEIQKQNIDLCPTWLVWPFNTQKSGASPLLMVKIHTFFHKRKIPKKTSLIFRKASSEFSGGHLVDGWLWSPFCKAFYCTSPQFYHQSRGFCKNRQRTASSSSSTRAANAGSGMAAAAAKPAATTAPCASQPTNVEGCWPASFTDLALES